MHRRVVRVCTGLGRADVGWCPGVIEKANGNKSKTVDGDMCNFFVYYEMDDDLSRHVLEGDSYEPDGPVNSWVMLDVGEPEVVEAAAVVVTTDAAPDAEMAEAPAEPAAEEPVAAAVVLDA